MELSQEPSAPPPQKSARSTAGTASAASPSARRSTPHDARRLRERALPSGSTRQQRPRWRYATTRPGASCLPHFLRELSDGVGAEHLLVDHTGEKLLRRPRPEPIDDLPDGFCRDARPARGWLVDEHFAFSRVHQVPPLFEPPQ